MTRPSDLHIPTDDIVEWLTKARSPTMPEGECIEFLQLFNPRTIFIKTLPKGARILDVGAGDGSLVNLKKWPKPLRNDLRMYAYALEKGKNFDAYDGFEIGDFEKGAPKFGAIKFDAVFCAHFIEHIANPTIFVEWVSSVLNSGGRFYLEWPSDLSTKLPSREALSKLGVNLIISNFFDDSTNRSIPERASIISLTNINSLHVEQLGVVRIPYFEEEVLAHFWSNNRDRPAVQLAFWSHYRWAQYIIAQK